MGRPAEQVLLVGGARLLPGTWTLREAFGAAPEVEVSAVLTETMGPAEEVVEAGEPWAEYARDFFIRLREMEADRAPGACGWATQPDINARMRSILVDWLVDVQIDRGLSLQALFLAVSNIDRYLERQTCKRKELQLLGVACFSLAAKFMDRNWPKPKDWAYLTDWSFTAKQVSDFEVKVLNVLNYEVSAPTAFQFLELHALASGVRVKGMLLALYLMELALVSGNMAGRPPSLLSAAATYLAHQQIAGGKKWPEGMIYYAGYAEEVLQPCAEELRLLHRQAACYGNKLKAVHTAFSKQAYGEVAKMQL